MRGLRAYLDSTRPPRLEAVPEVQPPGGRMIQDLVGALVLALTVLAIYTLLWMLTP